MGMNFIHEAISIDQPLKKRSRKSSKHIQTGHMYSKVFSKAIRGTVCKFWDTGIHSPSLSWKCIAMVMHLLSFCMFGKG